MSRLLDDWLTFAERIERKARDHLKSLGIDPDNWRDEYKQFEGTGITHAEWMLAKDDPDGRRTALEIINNVQLMREDANRFANTMICDDRRQALFSVAEAGSSLAKRAYMLHRQEVALSKKMVDSLYLSDRQSGYRKGVTNKPTVAKNAVNYIMAMTDSYAEFRSFVGKDTSIRISGYKISISALEDASGTVVRYCFEGDEGEEASLQADTIRKYYNKQDR